MFHFNHDKTVLSGEYGISMTIDQSFSDTLLLKEINNIDDLIELGKMYNPNLKVIYNNN